MLTAFGKYLRKIRIDRGEVLKDMAGKLSVSSAYLSAIETGKRKIPDGWVAVITELYNLSKAEKSELLDAAERSAENITLHFENTDEKQRKTAILFARNFETIDKEVLEKIRKILEKNGRGE